MLHLRITAALILTIAASVSRAQQSPSETNALNNGGFEQGQPGQRIAGWLVAERHGFRARISDDDPLAGTRCGVLQRDPGVPGESKFGTLNQAFVDVSAWQGKRVRFRAAVRTDVEGEGNEARLWLRVDRASQDGRRVVGAFDNMGDRPITSSKWKHYEIVADVAPDATGIILGMMLMGHGKAYIDDASFQEVGKEIQPTTRQSSVVAQRGRPRGTPMDQIGPGLFEVLGEMEVRPTATWPRDGTGQATLLLPMPLSYRDQVPLGYELTAQPRASLKSVSLVQDRPQNLVAKVVLVDLHQHKKVSLKFRAPVLVSPSNFDDAPESATIPEQWPESATPWLESTWCVESDHERVQAIAKEIRQQSDDVLQIIAKVEKKAKDIFRAADGRLRNLTAVEALDKRGSCTSCGNLVAALLRASDVPARVLSGYPAWAGPLQTHYMVEAYVPGYGWYPVESTLCRSPWPNSHQINVAIIPTEYETQALAGLRRSAAGGVPYLSLTESDRQDTFLSRGVIKDAPGCDHQCKMVRRFDAEDDQWNQAMTWAKNRWSSWTESEPSAKEGTFSFSKTAPQINAKSLPELMDQLQSRPRH